MLPGESAQTGRCGRDRRQPPSAGARTAARGITVGFGEATATAALTETLGTPYDVLAIPGTRTRGHCLGRRADRERPTRPVSDAARRSSDAQVRAAVPVLLSCRGSSHHGTAVVGREASNGLDPLTRGLRLRGSRPG